MPVEIDEVALVMDAIPRVISSQMYRDIIDILGDCDPGSDFSYCSFTELRRTLFEKPAGRWLADFIKDPALPVNLRPKMISKMLDRLMELDWVRPYSQIGFKLTDEGREQKRMISAQMFGIIRDLYREKVSNGT